MNRSILLVPLFLLLACDSDDRRSHAALAPEAAPAAHIRFVPAAQDGDVASQVRGALAETRRQGDALLVYVGATWCEPCQRFHQAATSGRLDGKFIPLTLLEYDLDRDRDRLAAAGYASRLIPLFAAPNDDGTASDKRFEGSIKGEGGLPLIEERLRALTGR